MPIAALTQATGLSRIRSRGRVKVSMQREKAGISTQALVCA
jgi:hypothetical protein